MLIQCYIQLLTARVGALVRSWEVGGGAGAWHVGRTLSNNPLSQLEAYLAWAVQEIKGVGTYMPYSGYRLSSTRMENIGYVLGFAADGPAHVGIDNAACIRIVDKLIGTDDVNAKPNKPWSRMVDGDLQSKHLPFIFISFSA